MNWDRLKKNIGYRVQLIPAACWINKRGEELPSSDDDWIIQEAGDDWIKLSNTRPNHFAVRGKDHFYSFTSNPGRVDSGLKFGFLTLRVQIFVQGVNLWVRAVVSQFEHGVWIADINRPCW
jgi:hypothetical protein